MKKNRLLTCFNKASYNGHKSVVEILLSNGGDVNIKSNGGVTPLHSGKFIFVKLMNN